MTGGVKSSRQRSTSYTYHGSSGCMGYTPRAGSN